VVRQLAGEGFTALLASRDPDKGRAAAGRPADEGLEVDVRELDVADADSLRALADAIGRDHGRLDVPVNNAAIHYDTWQHGVDADLSEVREALGTNLLGAWRMALACLPPLRRSAHGRIVNSKTSSQVITRSRAGTAAVRQFSSVDCASRHRWRARPSRWPAATSRSPPRGQSVGVA
jgi:NAD(P)-dependent dehydrogenase (short-subunit alcohol dehydrogenase family)